MSDETNAGDNAGDKGNEPSNFVSKDELRTIVSGMLRSSQEKVSKDLSGTLDAKFAEFAAKIAEANGQGKSKPAGDDDAEKPKGKPKGEPVAGDTAESPAFLKMQKEIEKLQKDNQQLAEQRARERAKANEDRAYAGLKEHLSGKVRAEAIGVIADAVRGRGLITYDEEGNAQMRVTVAAKGYEPEDQVLPIAEAIPHYLKSKEAALFLPAPTSQQAPKAKVPGARAPTGQFAGNPKSPSEAFEGLGFGSLEDNL